MNKYYCNVYPLKNNYNSIDGYFELIRNITALKMKTVIYWTRKNNARFTIFEVQMDACLFFNGVFKNNIGMLNLVSRDFSKVSNVRCPILAKVSFLILIFVFY